MKQFCLLSHAHDRTLFPARLFKLQPRKRVCWQVTLIDTPVKDPSQTLQIAVNSCFSKLLLVVTVGSVGLP